MGRLSCLVRFASLFLSCWAFVSVSLLSFIGFLPKSLHSLSGSATQLLNLSSGSQAESWTAQTGGLSWLSLDVTSGTLSAGQTQVLHVTVNPTALLPGTY